MMFARELVSECCGFLFYDHFKSYYEESDFCHRAWLAGKEVWYVSTEPIEHLCGFTASKFNRAEIMRQYIRNSFFSLSVNLGALARYLIVPAYSCVMIVHSLVHLVRGDLITCKTNLFVFREIYKLKKEIRKARAKINRARTDWWVLSRVLRLPPFRMCFAQCEIMRDLSCFRGSFFVCILCELIVVRSKRKIEQHEKLYIWYNMRNTDSER